MPNMPDTKVVCRDYGRRSKKGNEILDAKLQKLKMIKENGIAPEYYRNEFEGFLADIYDSFFNILTLFSIRRFREEAIRLVELKKGQSALDLACGTGGLTMLIADNVGEKGKVIGIDLSERMLNITIKKSIKYPQIAYERKNFENLNYRNKFDLVSIAFGAHEVPSKPRRNLYLQCNKALKNKRKLLVFELARTDSILIKPFYYLFLRMMEYPNGRQYISEDHQKILKRIGFNRIAYKKIGPVFEAAVYEKR